MPVLRLRRGVPLLLLLPFLPACALRIGPDHPVQETAWPAPTGTPAPTPAAFASTRKPGLRIPLNPQPDGPAPAAPIVPDAPPAPPPAAKDAPPHDLPPTVALPPPDAPLVAILKAFVEGRPEEAMPWVQTLDKPNREMVLQLIPALVKASRVNPAQADPKELSLTAEPLVAVANLLNKRAPLTIEKALFCRSIKNFGHYEPLPENAFLKPGTTNLIYFEIGNAASEPANRNGAEGYLTKLVCSWQLRDGDGKPIVLTSQTDEQRTELVETKADFSLSPLRDYFLLLWFTAPAKPGKYTVHFKVKEPATGREAVRALPFRVPN